MQVSMHNWMRAEPVETTIRRLAKYGYDSIEISYDSVELSPGAPGTKAVAQMLKDNGITNLAYHADPEGKILQVLQKSGHVVGLPTTFVVDASGCEIALLKGPAEWASPDAVAFMKAALNRS